MPDHYVEMRAALPASYVSYIESHAGWEGIPSGTDTYFILWDRGSIQENYAGYEMREYLKPRWFAFGSNGGGEMLCFDLEFGTDAVYLLPFIGMSNEEPILLHGSFGDLARRIESPA